MKKIPGYVIILHMCTKNYGQMMYSSSDMVRDGQTDGQTDGKSDISRWVPHLKNESHFLIGKTKNFNIPILVIMGHFLPFYPPPHPLKTKEIKILKK